MRISTVNQYSLAAAGLKTIGTDLFAGVVSDEGLNKLGVLVLDPDGKPQGLVATYSGHQLCETSISDDK